MDSENSIVLEHYDTGSTFFPQVAILVHPDNPENREVLQAIARAMRGKWGGTDPVLITDGGDGELRIVFASSENIDPRVTMQLHWLWLRHGWCVRVFALHNNAFFHVSFAEDAGEPWGEVPQELAHWFQQRMDEIMGGCRDEFEDGPKIGRAHV